LRSLNTEGIFFKRNKLQDDVDSTGLAFGEKGASKL